jgi:hypothetical protein
MDFNVRKFPHIFALLVLIVAFILLIVLPIVSYILAYFGVYDTTQVVQIAGNPFFELFTIFIQIIFFVILPILAAVLWYLLVNDLTIKEALHQMKLRIEGIDLAFLWGIISGIIILILVIAFGAIMVYLGYKSDELSNVPYLKQIFSPISLFIIVTIQPLGEEIFFRGFLLDKIGSMTGESIAIIITAILFGLAHMGYGLSYLVIMPVLMGIILGFIVVKTKKLYTAITAHVFFNLTVLVISFLNIYS